MFIIVLVMYYTILNRIRKLVETNREYYEMIEKNNNCKKHIQSDPKQRAIDELQSDLKTDYIHLFHHVQ